MADIRDLIPLAQLRGQEPISLGLWYAIIAVPVPLLLTDGVYVIIPDIDKETSWGPANWAPRTTSAVAMPSAGDEALVGWDNRRNLWVVTWWPA